MEELLRHTIEEIRTFLEAQPDTTAFAPLLEVVRKRCCEGGVYPIGGSRNPNVGRCPGCGVYGWRIGGTCGTCHKETVIAAVHGPCKGSGYVTRNWEGMPRGALRGSIEEAVSETPIESAYSYHYRKAVQRQLGEQYSSGVSPYEAKIDTDLAACHALIEALRGGV